jgi:hypothetical protein
VRKEGRRAVHLCGRYRYSAVFFAAAWGAAFFVIAYKRRNPQTQAEDDADGDVSLKP